jgi:DNA mismatch endonuclease (patch repair protein)
MPQANAAFWAEKLHRNVQRDRRVDAELAELGWQVIRVWEHSTGIDLEDTAAHIQDAVAQKLASIAGSSSTRVLGK